MKNFRCYQMAKDLYKLVQTEPLKGESRDQMVRASLRSCLNLIEGSARPTIKDRRRFFYMALSSLRQHLQINPSHSNVNGLNRKAVDRRPPDRNGTSPLIFLAKTELATRFALA